MPALKRKLKGGVATVGTWVTINHPDVVDALSELPFDWLIFDMEHAPLEVSDIEVLMMPLRGCEVAPIVRVPWNDMVAIKRALDIGAEGILIPWVSTREEAEAAIKYVSYPPQGLRGFGPRRAVRYGFRSFLDYYSRFEPEERVVVIQIETARALENLEDILSVKGIDVAFIGPADLTVNLGIPLQYSHPMLIEAISKTLKACEKYNIAAGIHAFDVNQAKKYIEEGFRFISIEGDIGFIIRAAKDILKTLNRI
ncbi:MAG: aldolase/citrate lyase family protein [Ignisphaera sp.]